MMLDFLVAESQKVDAEAFQFALAFLIVGLGLGCVMNGAVHFDREFQGFAVKVDDELINRALAIEVVAHHLFAFEMLPELSFTGRHIATQLASPFFQLGVVVNNRMPHDNQGLKKSTYRGKIPRKSSKFTTPDLPNSEFPSWEGLGVGHQCSASHPFPDLPLMSNSRWPVKI